MENSVDQFFLLLGEVDRDGVASKLKATGIGYQKKRLESKPDNWETILQLLGRQELIGVVAKLTSRTYALMSSDEYENLFARFLTSLQKVPHIVFVHEEVFTGETDEARKIERLQSYPDDDPEVRYHLENLDDLTFSPPTPEVRQYVNDLMYSHDINIVPYVKNAEMITMALAFVDQNEKNLVFRFYVPSGRMWSAESEKLLQLFRDYLVRVSKIKIRQDQYSTSKGTVFEFFSDHTMDPATLPAEFREFSTLLDLCVVEPANAMQMLQGKSMESRAVQEIVDRYAKEAKRLHIDLKHERERKLLSIRQRMESELIEVVPNDADWGELERCVEQIVPRLTGVSSALGLSSQGLSHPSQLNLTVNYGPQVIGSVQGIVAQEVSGNQQIGVEASQFIEFINQWGGSRKAELVSAVHEVEDVDARKEDRLTAGQKLKGFLFKVGDKLGDVGMEILKSYIEKQMGL